MYYICLDVHKKTISYCLKEASGQIHRQGTMGATRHELDAWMATLPQPWSVAMEATIFTGWIAVIRKPASFSATVLDRLNLESKEAARSVRKAELNRTLVVRAGKRSCPATLAVFRKMILYTCAAVD